MKTIADITDFIFLENNLEEADKLGLQINKAIICPCEVQGISKETWFHSEDGIDKVMGELMRSGAQFKSYIMELMR